MATVDELIIMFNDEKVKLFIKSVEVEEEIVCNGTTYEIDLFFEFSSKRNEATRLSKLFHMICSISHMTSEKRLAINSLV